MTGFGLIGFAGLAAVPQILLGTTAVMTVLCIELPRSLGMVDLNARDVLVGCKRFFAYCAPEAVGLATVFLVAVLLRLRGDLQVPKDPLAAEVWEEIKEEWPVLMGADTLLNLQSMLRLLIFMSAAFRAGLLPYFKANEKKTVATPMVTDQINGSPSVVTSPLFGTGAALSLGGMLARVRLCTQAEIYRLEGPLSLDGDLPMMCDLCSMLLLSGLAFSSLRPSTGAAVRTAAATAFALWVASKHYLNLAKDSSLDSLFTLTHVLEFLAALAFLGRAAMNSSCEIQGSHRGRAFIGFVHVLMAFQQALSAYYFLTAFEPSPKLIAAGRPFCILVWSNLLAFGAYLCAAGLYFGGLSAEVSESSNYTSSSTDRIHLPMRPAHPEALSTSINIPAGGDVEALASINL
mmetsp:Transcript_17519/g.32453  ORF Transcript_17519/g.32453 Transcript_17519/m.32453 type:complete len:404 (+) Transcript_17519:86-1297(+)